MSPTETNSHHTPPITRDQLDPQLSVYYNFRASNPRAFHRVPSCVTIHSPTHYQSAPLAHVPADLSPCRHPCCWPASTDSSTDQSRSACSSNSDTTQQSDSAPSRAHLDPQTPVFLVANAPAATCIHKTADCSSLTRARDYTRSRLADVPSEYTLCRRNSCWPHKSCPYCGQTGIILAYHLPVCPQQS